MTDKSNLFHSINQYNTFNEILPIVRNTFDLIINKKEWIKDFFLHPLGFYYCRLFQTKENQIRLHIWEKNYLTKDDFCIHDHYYDLCSWVLRGEIIDFTYDINPSSEKSPYIKFISGYRNSENYRISKRTDEFVTVEKLKEITIREGERYYIPINTFHSNKILFKNTDITVTLVFTYNHKDNHSPNIIGLNQSGDYLEDQPKSISSDKIKSLIEKANEEIFDKK